MYLKQSQLEIDKHVKACGVFAYYTANADNVDRRLRTDCIGIGAKSSDIIIDGNGNITNEYLIDMLVNYCIMMCLSSNADVVAEDGNTFGVKSLAYAKKYNEMKLFLTRSRVKNG